MNDMTGAFPVDATLAANFRLLQDVDVKLTALTRPEGLHP